jgi:site-specific DNA-cytosine methylase
VLDLLGAQPPALHHEHQPECDELPRHHAHLQEPEEEALAIFRCDFAQVRGARAVLAAHRQALQQACSDQHDRRENADGRVAGRERNHHRADAHRQHRTGKRRLAAATIRVQPDEPATQGARHITHGSNGRRIHQLDGRVVAGEERLREVDREDAVGEKVVPLDQVARETADDGPEFDGRTIRRGRGFRGKRGGGLTCGKRILGGRHNLSPILVV